ncbi:siderophore-interacting protein [Aquipuribacter sp. SD81]|uniref:siderophore-interacting protein n=1 Tax=Aquipuribacter sp. SD81 TaxID=3127703 RepID=UPI003019B25E
MRHGWEGVVLRAMRGRDFVLTVGESEDVTDRYRRVRVTDDGGLLAACGTHPTMWVRLWFDDGGSPHQRAYTLVDPDPAAGTFDLEFALHDGVAARWAQSVRPGATIDATVQGTGFDPVRPAPRRMHVVGDPASLPAVNSLLDASPGTPARLWLEHGADSDRTLPLRLRAGDEVTWVARHGAAVPGGALVAAVTQAWTCPAADVDVAADWFWLAAEAASTRALARTLRKELGVAKDRCSALGYWRAG